VHDRVSLRRELRNARRALGPAARRSASRQACDRLRRLPWFRRARRVAIYLPLPREADPGPLIAHDGHRRFHVPVLAGHGGMRFVRLAPGMRKARNRLGIVEPIPPERRLRRPGALDLVVMPLVGFDAHCNRLGQGGGHYDRSFAFLARRRLRHGGPRLVGLAFECQRVEALPHRDWDIPLDAVVTEARVYMR
jgi:5-formyltetrahydrofolate cyclo-ligase